MAVDNRQFPHDRQDDSRFVPMTRDRALSDEAGVLHKDNAMPRILVVEDEPLVLMVAVDLLEEMGCRVDEAGNALEALEKVSELDTRLDAAVIDLGLPDRKGDELAAELRTQQGDLPIVIASGHSEADLKARFKHDPQIRVLSKPYSGEQLGAALQSLGIALTATA